MTSSNTSTSVGYLVLSSLGDPLVETWRFSPSHHGTRPNPELIARMVLTAFLNTNNKKNQQAQQQQDDQQKQKSIKKIETASLCISYSSLVSSSLQNQEEEEEEKQQKVSQSTATTLQLDRDSSLQIYALKFHSLHNNNQNQNIDFISVVMRIISINKNQVSDEDFAAQNYFLATRSWTDACSLAMWFSSIVDGIDWLKPISENIEKQAKSNHDEQNFDTGRVLDDNNHANNKSHNGSPLLMMNKVLRTFHSAMLPFNFQNNEALANMLNLEKSASPNARRNSTTTISNNNKNNSTTQPQQKENNSLSICHEVFLEALRNCLILNFQQEDEKQKRENADQKQPQDQQQRQIDGEMVTAEADIILDDFQEQILYRHSFIDDHFIPKVSTVGVLAITSSSSSSSTSSWIVKPSIPNGFQADGDDEVTTKDKWEQTICPRLLKLVRLKVEKATKEKKHDENEDVVISNTAFRFFEDRIEVLLNEISIQQDEEDFYHRVGVAGTSATQTTKMFVVVLNV